MIWQTILSAFKNFINGDKKEYILEDILFIIDHTRIVSPDNKELMNLCDAIESLINDED